MLSRGVAPTPDAKAGCGFRIS